MYPSNRLLCTSIRANSLIAWVQVTRPCVLPKVKQALATREFALATRELWYVLRSTRAKGVGRASKQQLLLMVAWYARTPCKGIADPTCKAIPVQELVRTVTRPVLRYYLLACFATEGSTAKQ